MIKDLVFFFQTLIDQNNEQKKDKITAMSSSRASSPNSVSTTSTPPESPKTDPGMVSLVDAVQSMSRSPITNAAGQTVLSTQELNELADFIQKHKTEIQQLAPIDLDAISQEYQTVNPEKRVDSNIAINRFQPHTLRYSYKNERGLPRTIDIAFDHNNQIFLVVHTNQKVHNTAYNTLGNTNSPTLAKNPAAKLGKGSYKIAKLCYTLRHGKLIPIVRLQYELASNKDLQELLKEMQFARRHIGSEYIDTPVIGSIYRHTKNAVSPKGTIKTTETTACYIYSTPALCSLEKLESVSNGKSFLTPNERSQIAKARKNGNLPDIYQNIIIDIIHGLQEIHAAGEIHRDIKPDNILIYRDVKGILHAKVSDPGLAVTINTKSTPTATFDYASPQVFYANMLENAEYYHYYGLSMAEFTCPGRLQYEEKGSKFSKTDLLADPKDDMYALGICIMRLLKGMDVTFFQNEKHNPNWMIDALNEFKSPINIYSQLLATNRKDRPSAEELLRVVVEQKNSKKKPAI